MSVYGFQYVYKICAYAFLYGYMYLCMWLCEYLREILFPNMHVCVRIVCLNIRRHVCVKTRAYSMNNLSKAINQIPVRDLAATVSLVRKCKAHA